MSKADVCFLQETKIENVSGDLVRKIWGNDREEFCFAKATGKSGGLISMWDKEGFKVSKEYTDTRFVVVKGIWLLQDMESILINAYAPNTLTVRYCYGIHCTI